METKTNSSTEETKQWNNVSYYTEIFINCCKKCTLAREPSEKSINIKCKAV